MPPLSITGKVQLYMLAIAVDVGIILLSSYACNMADWRYTMNTPIFNAEEYDTTSHYRLVMLITCTIITRTPTV